MVEGKWLIWIAGAVSLAACRPESITHVRLAKSAEEIPAQQPGAPQEQDDTAPEAEGPVRLEWTLPAGWTSKLETGMRYATLTPEASGGVAGKVDVSVVMLPGMAGAELAIVNRWRGQLGLSPIDETQLARIRKPMSSDAGPLELFDLVSDGQDRSRMLAAVLATKDGSAWFLKMTGSPEAVRSRQPQFLRLLTSLRFAGAAEEQGQP